MELKLNIMPPDGYEAIRIGIPTAGELFVELDRIGIDGKVNGRIVEADCCGVYTLKLILRKKKQRKEIIIFESTGEFREPVEGDYYRITNEYPLAIGHKPYDCIKVGAKKIFRCVKNHTYED